jgi:hypothetical protein
VNLGCYKLEQMSRVSAPTYLRSFLPRERERGHLHGRARRRLLPGIAYDQKKSRLRPRARRTSTSTKGFAPDLSDPDLSGISAPWYLGRFVLPEHERGRLRGRARRRLLPGIAYDQKKSLPCPRARRTSTSTKGSPADLSILIRPEYPRPGTWAVLSCQNMNVVVYVVVLVDGCCRAQLTTKRKTVHVHVARLRQRKDSRLIYQILIYPEYPRPGTWAVLSCQNMNVVVYVVVLVDGCCRAQLTTKRKTVYVHVHVARLRQRKDLRLICQILIYPDYPHPGTWAVLFRQNVNVVVYVVVLVDGCCRAQLTTKIKPSTSTCTSHVYVYVNVRIRA